MRTPKTMAYQPGDQPRGRGGNSGSGEAMYITVVTVEATMGTTTPVATSEALYILKHTLINVLTLAQLPGVVACMGLCTVLVSTGILMSIVFFLLASHPDPSILSANEIYHFNGLTTEKELFSL
jgi:hypothetical protein